MVLALLGIALALFGVVLAITTAWKRSRNGR
jgi:hypothetical protein